MVNYYLKSKDECALELNIFNNLIVVILDINREVCFTEFFSNRTTVHDFS